MTIKESSFSVVIAGQWNRSILNPAWLVANLFEDNPEVQVEFSLNFDMPSRYRVKNIIIAPTDEKVIFLSTDNSDESLKLIEYTAIKLCNILSHTPFVAVGINFSFIESTEKDKLLPLMSFTDSDDLSDKGWGVYQKSIKRFIVNDFYKLNLSIMMDDNSDFHFDLNYHYQISNVTQIEENLYNRVISYKEMSFLLLNQLYNLNLS